MSSMATHPLQSVTVTEYAPDEFTVILDVVSPVDHKYSIS